ncbi:MAG: glycolate oxidase subunit GlcE [Proteobacteria bacterium]|nr:MAG: glycolate oxidase subunit GlcE [Pseudomonadota bacterium]
MTTDLTRALQERVVAAAADRTPLAIMGGGSKGFYGRASTGTPIGISGHCGIVAYEPKELVITARAGTSLREVEETLAAQGQMLPFEPPHFGSGATIGGMVATGLSGPRRPYTGSVRDYVLGVRMLNGQGEQLRFGGEVMKNVAGYDLSRLMTGSLGILGIILEVSLKVLPKPEQELTLLRECDAGTAVEFMNTTAAKPLPVSGACHDGTVLRLRLSGTSRAVAAASRELGGSEDGAGERFWRDLRELAHPFLQPAADPLWRVAVRSTTPPLGMGEEWIDWGGAQRWLRTDSDSETVREAATAAGGHALVFSGGDRGSAVFHPLSPALALIHSRLKQAFDPQRLFNPGRLYATL